MDYILIGTIQKIIPLEYGIALMVRETHSSFTSKGGKMFKGIDYRWNCLAQSEASRKYVQSIFRVGALVKIVGVAEQTESATEKEFNLKNLRLKISTITFFDTKDPTKERMRERMNEMVTGDEKPPTGGLDDFQ